MAGFRKAKAEQAALKIGMYGPSGSGKTFTGLLMAEGLAKASGKRVAVVDTERGTDFYCKKVDSRRVHPAEFDFDAIYTRSITEVLQAVKDLDPAVYGVLMIDSITHIWEATIKAYEGRTTRAGTIPMHAWGSIKKPYKEMIAHMLSSPMHFIICGRQGNEYTTDEATDELRMSGVKMKAEGETPYEPHILIRMEAVRPKPKAEAVITAFIEKDRTGILNGKVIINPTYDLLCAPIMPLLGGQQAKVESDDEVATRDAEAMSDSERKRLDRSGELFAEFNAQFDLAHTAPEVEAVAKKLTKGIKDEMLPAHVTQLREKYQDRSRALGGRRTVVEVA